MSAITIEKHYLERWKLKWIFGENVQKQSSKTFSSGSLSLFYLFVDSIFVVTSFSICSKMNFHFGYKIWCDDKNQVTKINKQYHGVEKCESPLTVRSNKMICWCEQWPFFCIYKKKRKLCIQFTEIKKHFEFKWYMRAMALKPLENKQIQK